jgi:NAD+ synthase
MVSLYQISGYNKGIVVGTGNKIEDFGVGFFTKYGDGGVDISPIADLTKTEVKNLAKSLGVIPEILNAKPTDGLWDDDRNDEDQIGATYSELEWAMSYLESKDQDFLTERQKEVLEIYTNLNNKNKHKMLNIPIFYRK